MKRTEYSLNGHRKLILFFLLLSLFYPCIPTTSAESVVSISPSSQTVYANQGFDVYINIDPETPIAGAQLDILYDADMLSVNSVNEGDFFSQNGATSIFIGGTVDDDQGEIDGLFAVTLGKSEISTEGEFAHITFTTADVAGDCIIDISNVILSDSEGHSVPVATNNAQVTIRINSSSSLTDETNTGSGGGGGGDSGEDAENIALKEVQKLYVTAGTDIKYSFDESSNPISSISYRSLKNAGFITSTIDVLKDASSIVSEKPEGLVYRNMNIWIGKAGYATENNMEDMRISFVVLKNWIQVNDVDEDTIHMKRYHDGNWETLETEITGENEDFFFFEAETPGFSPFAITADVPDSMNAESFSSSELLPHKNRDLGITTFLSKDGKFTENSSSLENSSLKLAQNTVLITLISVSMIVLCRRKN